MTPTPEKRLWHGLATMGLRDGGLTIVRGRGARVFDDEGRSYIDATASLWYCNVGHGRTEIAEAVFAQMQELATFHTYELVSNVPAQALAEKVCELVPLENPRVFFTPGGGGDAIDTAAKLSRAYWRAAGRAEKTMILSRTSAFHGNNAYGTSIGGIPGLYDSVGPLVGEVERVAWDDADALRAAVERIGPERIAAFFCEPVIGAGGVLYPPPGYLAEVESICRDADVLFVLDEVITGFGRLGSWFACERFSLRPDILVVAKGLTSGYLPLGAAIVSERVVEPFWRRGSELTFRHGYTYSGHPTACAAALANIAILEREGLVERARTMEPVLESALRALVGHPLVSEVRSGLGLLSAVEITRPELLRTVVAEARSRGVLTRGIAGRALQVSPPLPISEEEIATIAGVFAESLDSAEAAAA